MEMKAEWNFQGTIIAIFQPKLTMTMHMKNIIRIQSFGLEGYHEHNESALF